MDKGNVPPPADEEPISYIYNANTQTVHKWPGCRNAPRAVTAMSRPWARRKGWRRPEYWSPSEYNRAVREHGAVHRCRLCFGKR